MSHQRRACLRAAALVGALPAVLALGCGEPKPTDGPNVLLITVDTMRADRLGCYGYPVPTTPNLDRLAREGVLFADCTVQWPKTWPSMASLVTGAYPRTTGIQQAHRRLPGALTVLSEVFGGAGYRTAAVVANFNVGRALGFDQGFDHFVESWQERWEREKGQVEYINRPGRVKEYTDAATVSQQGLAWLNESDPEQPYFLWLHYMDPHGPYVPPAPWSRTLEDVHPSEPVALDLLPGYQVQQPDGYDGPIADMGFYRTQYDREVLYFDAQLGLLRQELEAAGLLDDTVIILSADHGESFDEHRYYLEHGKFAYQPTAHVPLIVQGSAARAGRVVRDAVGLIDVSATLPDLAGVPVPEQFEGRSLAPVALDEAGAELPPFVFVESGYVPGQSQRVVREGRWKLIHVPAETDRSDMTGEELELYDLETDPAELVNVARDNPDVVRRLFAVLEQWYESGPDSVPVGEEIDLETLAPEAREMLEALGYTGD
ncbi:MAG TPA: sulfatase [bacterium]|nr:sulfatase [bacterium]